MSLALNQFGEVNQHTQPIAVNHQYVRPPAQAGHSSTRPNSGRAILLEMPGSSGDEQWMCNRESVSEKACLYLDGQGYDPKAKRSAQ